MLEILVQTATGTSNLASTSVPFGSNTTNGNSIIVGVGNSSTSAGDVSGITDTQGNVYQIAFTTDNALIGDLELWYTSNIVGGANTITVAYTTGVSCAVIAREYYGTAYPINILDKQTSNTGNSNSLSSGSIQPVQSYELLIGVGLVPLANTFTVGSGWNNLVTQGAPLTVAIAMEDQFVASVGLQTATFGASGAIQWVCGIGSFFLAPTGTTTSTSFTTSTSLSSTSASSTSSSVSSTSSSTSNSSTSTSISITTVSTSSTSSSVSSTSISSTSSSTSISSTSSSISSTSTSSTSQSSTSTSTSISSTSTSFSSTSSSVSSTSISISSTSASSTSSSSSTSTTTLPPPYYDYTYQDMGNFTVVDQFGLKSPTSWVCPANVTSVFAQCWAGGGSGGNSNSDPNSNSGGGGGGEYAAGTVSVTPGTSYAVVVGVGGAAIPVLTDSAGNAGGNSSFGGTLVIAIGGSGGAVNTNGNTAAGGTGGTGGTGSILNNGGTGGSDVTTNANGGGGGGGAGSSTAGGTGGNSTGAAGTAGAGGSSNGGAGSAGAGSSVAANAKPFGGGGGGSGFSASGGGPSGAGGAGFVQLTYTTNQAPPSTSNDLVNPFNSIQYGNVSTNDGGYQIQTGSQVIIQEYKSLHQNNTDNINFTWWGRSTVAPSVSPFYVQVYNQNTLSWQTVASQTTQPADTDFGITVSITTTPGNYYNTSNQVIFRTYQQVV